MNLRWKSAHGLRGLALAVVLVACSPAVAEPTATLATPTLAPVIVSTIRPTLAPTAVSDATVEPGEAPATDIPAPTAVEPTIAPPTATAFVISEDFTPSDPASVNLAAGKPQLVEFFAFW
jgi:hypothetical protein